MKNAMQHLKPIAKKFLAAYDAHDVEGMTALCADDALGRYAPYGLKSVVPIRGGLDGIWRAFTQAVPDFRVEVIEMIQAEGNTMVVQAALGGTMPTDAPGIAKRGQVVRIPHAYILRYTMDGKISRLDCYWDNTAINGIKASEL